MREKLQYTKRIDKSNPSFDIYRSVPVIGIDVDIFVTSKTGPQLFEYMIKKYGHLIGNIGLYSDENLKAKFIDNRPKQAKKIIAGWYYNSRGIFVSLRLLMHKITGKYNVKLIG